MRRLQNNKQVLHTPIIYPRCYDSVQISLKNIRRFVNNALFSIPKWNIFWRKFSLKKLFLQTSGPGLQRYILKLSFLYYMK